MASTDDHIKREAVAYALQVVPGGKGRGGTRGASEAARLYGFAQRTVSTWIRSNKYHTPDAIFETADTAPTYTATSAGEKGLQTGSVSGLSFTGEVALGTNGFSSTHPHEGGFSGSLLWCGRIEGDQSHTAPQSGNTLTSWAPLMSQGHGNLTTEYAHCLNYENKCTPMKVDLHPFPQNNVTDAFKAEVLNYAHEVVPGGKGKGGSRGISEAARKYGLKTETIYFWMQDEENREPKPARKTDALKTLIDVMEESTKYEIENAPAVVEKEPSSENQAYNTRRVKGKIPEELKNEIVNYALEVLPDGKGKGNTRGAFAAARKYGLAQQTVHTWVQNAVYLKSDRTSITEDLKKEAVQFALQVVPDGKSKGGTRGAYEASRKFSVSHMAVRSWMKEAAFIGKSAGQNVSAQRSNKRAKASRKSSTPVAGKSDWKEGFRTEQNQKNESMYYNLEEDELMDSCPDSSEDPLMCSEDLGLEEAETAESDEDIKFNTTSKYIERVEIEGLSAYDIEREPRKKLDPSGEVLASLRAIRGELSCPICFRVMRETVVVKQCLHRFCSQCIQKSLRVARKECPICRIPIASRRFLRSDNDFDKLITIFFPDLDAYEALIDKTTEDFNRMHNMHNGFTEYFLKKNGPFKKRRRKETIVQEPSEEILEEVASVSYNFDGTPDSESNKDNKMEEADDASEKDQLEELNEAKKSNIQLLKEKEQAVLQIAELQEANSLLVLEKESLLRELDALKLLRTQTEKATLCRCFQTCVCQEIPVINILPGETKEMV